MRVRTSGIIGIHDGFYGTANWPSDNTIDGDNDGYVIPTPNYLIDLSKLASVALGRQAPMMASYKLHSMTIGIRPSDDTIDNDHAAHFGGLHYYYLATDHAKKALQMARQVEKNIESAKVDADSVLLGTDRDYSGFRYTWYPGTSYDVVEHATTCDVPTMGSKWNLKEIFHAYDDITRPCETNAMFDGRAPGIIDTLWECGWSNKPWGAMGTGRGDCIRDMHLEVLPLIAGAVRYSHVNEPGTVDDEYHVWVEVDFTIGGSF